MSFPNKFIIGGALMVVAIIALIVAAVSQGSQYFLTVEELQTRQAEVTGREVRISGAVVGDTISFDPETLRLAFTVAHVPGDTEEIERMGGLGLVLHNAVNDPSLPRLQVVYIGERPDLMRNEAQAIMTGKLGEDGIFYAEELLLKCPSRYDEAVPDQSASN